MDTRFAISEYLDAAQVTAQLDALIKKPIYSISPAALKKYEEEYFDKKCAKSKAMITEASDIIYQLFVVFCQLLLDSLLVFL